MTTFNKNIAEIPCLRNSYFYGIWSGIAGGLGHFMFTSKPRISTHFGMGTFCISTLTYWLVKSDSQYYCTILIQLNLLYNSHYQFTIQYDLFSL